MNFPLGDSGGGESGQTKTSHAEIHCGPFEGHAGLTGPERSPEAIAPAITVEYAVMAGAGFEALWGSAQIELLPMGRILEAPDSPLVVSRPWRPMP